MNQEEHRKLCAAKYAWKYRDRVVPSAQRKGMRTTWKDWFAKMYGEDLSVYRRRVSKNVNRIR